MSMLSVQNGPQEINGIWTWSHVYLSFLPDILVVIILDQTCEYKFKLHCQFNESRVSCIP